MFHNTPRLLTALTTSPDHGALAHPGPGAALSGLVAVVVACGVPLAQGLSEGWPPVRTVAYLALTVLFLALSQAVMLGHRAGRWLVRHEALYLLLIGLLGFGLQTLSGDPFVQPIIFTVPLVHAVLVYSPLRVAAIGAFYLGLMALGLWLNDPYSPLALLFPLAAYGALMVFMYVFTRLSAEQSTARARADQLAATLMAERDELARLAAENARLVEQASLTATLAERNRLARELHDTIAQGLTAVTMQLEAAQRSFDRDPARARGRLGRAHELARQTLDDVRRSVWMLAEPLVESADLGLAIEDLAQRFTTRTGTPVTCRGDGPPPVIEAAAATQVLRIVQEALQNVDKHAQAAHVWIDWRSDDQGLRVSVRDDGIGFDGRMPASTTGAGGFGLLSLRERAHLTGGELIIQTAPGAGTTVVVTIPGER